MTHGQEKRDKPIAVYDKDRTHLSNCTRKRAAQMVHREKAKWIGRDQIMLLVTSQEEKEIRRRVRKRDGLRCYICDEQLTINTVTYDHKIPRAEGGAETEENLACCCRNCNELKADRTVEEFVLHLWTWVMFHVLWHN